MALDFIIDNQQLTVLLSSDLRKYDNQKQIDRLFNALPNIKTIHFDASDLKSWDSNIAAVLFRLSKECKLKHITLKLIGLPKDLQKLLQLAFTVENNV